MTGIEPYTSRRSPAIVGPGKKVEAGTRTHTARVPAGGRWVGQVWLKGRTRGLVPL